MPRAPAPCGSCRRGAQGIPPTAFERIRNRTERRGRNDIGQRDALTPKITEPLFQPFDLVLLKVGPISRRRLVAPLARRDSRTRGAVGTIGTTRKNSCHAARRFSACNGVLARLDLLVTGLDGGNIGHGTANVDIGPTMRRALVLRGALLAFAIRCGITARWAVSLRQAVGHLGDDLLAQLLAERGARFAAEYIGREPNGHGAVGRRRGGLWIRVVREPGSRPASRTTSSYGWLLALSALTGTGEESRDPEPFKAELEGHLDLAVELLLAPQGSLGGPLRLPLLPREHRTGAHPLEGVGQGSLASPRTPHRALPGRAGVRTAIHRAHRLGASSPGSGFPRAPRSRWRRRHTWRAQCWPPSSPGRPPAWPASSPATAWPPSSPGRPRPRHRSSPGSGRSPSGPGALRR